MKSDFKIDKIVGKQRVLDQIFDMIDTSKDEIDITMRYWGGKWGRARVQDEIGFAKFVDTIIEAVARGVRVRVIGDVDDINLPNIEKLRSAGANLKVIESGFLRFIIKDKSELLIATSESYTEDLHYYYAIHSDNLDLLEFFKDHFNNLWKNADEFSIK